MTYHTKWKAFLKENENKTKPWQMKRPWQSKYFHDGEQISCSAAAIVPSDWEELQVELRREFGMEFRDLRWNKKHDMPDPDRFSSSEYWRTALQDLRDDWTVDFNDAMTNYDKKWAAWQRHYEGEINQEEWDQLRAQHEWKDIDASSAELNSLENQKMAEMESLHNYFECEGDGIEMMHKVVESEIKRASEEPSTGGYPATERNPCALFNGQPMYPSAYKNNGCGKVREMKTYQGTPSRRRINLANEPPIQWVRSKQGRLVRKK